MNKKLSDHDITQLNKELECLTQDIFDQVDELREGVKSFGLNLTIIAQNCTKEKIDDLLFVELLLAERKLYEKRELHHLIKSLRSINSRIFPRLVRTETETGGSNSQTEINSTVNNV